MNPRNRQPAEERGAGLWNFEFAALCAISVLAFSNLAIFYGFYDYLAGLGIPPSWRGPLLALEPFTALVLRPFFGRHLTLSSGPRFMGVGLVLASLSLVSYPFATSIPALIVVRMVHGAGFVAIVSGLMGLLAVSLPRDRTAQGFGLFSITVLVPNAVMPFFVELLLPRFPGQGTVYALAAPLMLPALLLLVPLGKRTRERMRGQPGEHLRKPGRAEVRDNLRRPGVLLLTMANFCLLTAHAVVFFFIRDVAVGLGAGNAGVFFTCVNAATIAVRIGSGRRLDRLDKGRLLFLALLGLAILVPLFVRAGLPPVLFGLAALYGAGLGLTMPLVNAGMIQISAPRLRAFNTNLLLFAMDAGFFAGPFLGGLLVAAGWTRAGLFALAGGLLLAAGLCVLPAARQMRREAAEGAARA